MKIQYSLFSTSLLNVVQGEASGGCGSCPRSVRHLKRRALGDDPIDSCIISIGKDIVADKARECRRWVGPWKNTVIDQ